MASSTVLIWLPCAELKSVPLVAWCLNTMFIVQCKPVHWTVSRTLLLRIPMFRHSWQLQVKPVHDRWHLKIQSLRACHLRLGSRVSLGLQQMTFDNIVSIGPWIAIGLISCVNCGFYLWRLKPVLSIVQPLTIWGDTWQQSATISNCGFCPLMETNIDAQASVVVVQILTKYQPERLTWDWQTVAVVGIYSKREFLIWTRSLPDPQRHVQSPTDSNATWGEWWGFHCLKRRLFGWFWPFWCKTRRIWMVDDDDDCECG